MGSTRIVELERTQTLSPTVKALRFACVDGRPLGHVAGQWVNVDVSVGEGVVRRAYSVASAPPADAGNTFELGVTRVNDGGGASTTLHALEPGARLNIDGPHGFFTREQAHATPALLVATGTGVCPFRAMLEQELAQPDGPKLTLLFGCRSEADLLWRAEFERWAEDRPRFAFYPTLSRPGQSWSGLHGYVQTHLATLLAGDRPHVYVCGLTKMVSEVRRVLKEELGFDRRFIHSERYD